MRRSLSFLPIVFCFLPFETVNPIAISLGSSIHMTTSQALWIFLWLIINLTEFPVDSSYKPLHSVSIRKLMVPDVKSGNDCRILGLVATADVVTTALVGHQLFVRLDDDRVKVLDESVFLLNASQAGPKCCKSI